MDKFLASITSFLSIWFNDIKRHVFKVEIVNKKESSLLEKQIAAVISSLNLVSKQLERSNSSQSNEYMKGLARSISDLIGAIKSTKELNVSRLESSIDSLVSAVKRTEVSGRVSVDNLPLVQKVSGDISMSNVENITKGLQVIVDVLEDLKVNLPKDMGNVVSSYAGQTGSHKDKGPGITKFDPDDSAPTYIGTHSIADALTTDPKWTILKYTYSGSNATQIVKREGAWVDRATLF